MTFEGKKIIILGERDGVPGPAIAACMAASGAEVVYSVTECFVWTSAGAMDSESQATIKKLVDEIGAENLVVVLGSANLELAEVAARTVTAGDPSFAGPLAGVSLRLPVFHILEPEVEEAIPAEVYEKQAGFMAMIVNTEELGRRMKEARRIMEQAS